MTCPLPGRAFALILCLLATRSAHARTAELSLRIDPCLDVEAAALRRLASLELKGLSIVELAARQPPLVGWIDAGCDGERAQLRYTDVGSGRAIERAIAFESVPVSARPRLLALAIAELVSAARIETAIFPEGASTATSSSVTPKPSTEGALPSSEAGVPSSMTPPRSPAPTLGTATAVRVVGTPSVPSRAPGSYRLLALASVGGYFGRSGLLAGAALRGAADHPRGLAWAIELEVLHGARDSALGQVTLDTISVGSGVGYAHAFGRVSLRALAGVRGGAARLAGHPAMAMVSGMVVWGPYVGPIVQVGVTVAATRRLALELIAEGGYVAVRVEGRAGEDVIAEVGGPSLGLKLGLGIFP